MTRDPSYFIPAVLLAVWYLFVAWSAAVSLLWYAEEREAEQGEPAAGAIYNGYYRRSDDPTDSRTENGISQPSGRAG